MEQLKHYYELSGRDDWALAHVTYKESNWPITYSEKSRTYEISPNNRYFESGKISNSLMGHCLDGTESVRLDWYYEWEVEKVVIVKYK